MLTIDPTYGTSQQFQFRVEDLTIHGMINGLSDIPKRSEFRLNNGEFRPFYVEPVHDEGTDWLNGYKKSPGELRCRHFGEFCVEISRNDPRLRIGKNQLELVIAAGNDTSSKTVEFDWNPAPLQQNLDLSDLGAFVDIQQVGQIVNGAFDLDSHNNLIRSRAPVAPDALMVIGSPGKSQEATYRVRFLEPVYSKWLGLSDFHVGMVEGVPPRGIKVGWSSAGMAVAMPTGGARSFIAWGDHSSSPDEWAIATNPPAKVEIKRGCAYRVRHQIQLNSEFNRVRFRIWPEGTPEPNSWICDEHIGQLPAGLPRHKAASFSLFQHMGMPVEWSDIRLIALSDDVFEKLDPQSGRVAFLKRDRPGAF